MEKDKEHKPASSAVANVCSEIVAEWHEKHCGFHYDVDSSSPSISIFSCKHGFSLPPVYEDLGSGG